MDEIFGVRDIRENEEDGIEVEETTALLANERVGGGIRRASLGAYT